jgi:CheY-like chemotaxis protein
MARPKSETGGRGEEALREKARILIVDEDQEFVQASLPALVDRGYEVILATSCEEGLSKVQEVLPDLILIDLIMDKRGEGILFARKLRRNSQFKAFSQIPLLMLSDIKQQMEFTFPSLTEHPFFLPVDEFLEKPVSPELLWEKVEALLKAATV